MTESFSGPWFITLGFRWNQLRPRIPPDAEAEESQNHKKHGGRHVCNHRSEGGEQGQKTARYL